MSKIQKYVKAMYAGGSMKDRRLDDFVSPVPKKTFSNGGVMNSYNTNPISLNTPNTVSMPGITPGPLELNQMSSLDTSGSQLLNMETKTPMTSAQISAAASGVQALGAGVESLADDQDATTFTAGEIGGGVLKGAGQGAIAGAMIAGPLGAAVGAGVGAVSNIVGGLVKRGRGRKQEEERKKQFKIKATSLAGQDLMSSRLSTKQTESEASAKNLASAYEKYGVQMEKGGIVKNKASDKYYSEDYLRFKDSVGLRAGGLLRGTGTRPEDLKYMKP